MAKNIDPSFPPHMYIMSATTISQHGQALLKVIKDGKLDRGGNAYVQIQVPQDFAEYLLALQNEHREVDLALDSELSGRTFLDDDGKILPSDNNLDR